MKRIETRITQQLGIRYPIVGAPMFLWSKVPLVKAISQAGGIGMFPAMNYRNLDELDQALHQLEGLAYGVNIIANKAKRKETLEYLALCKNHKTPVVVTSLGSPKEAIEIVHNYGGKVWCDVTDPEFAAKVAKYQPDALVGVIKGAGGHHGHLSADELIKQLCDAYPDIPILQGGKIADAKTFKDALERGAEGAYMGTRFLVASECATPHEYKQAILQAEAKDIVSTNIFSGAECTAIRTESLEKLGIRLGFPWNQLIKVDVLKKYVRGYLFNRAPALLQQGSGGNPYYQVFVAGEAVEMINSVESTEKIIEDLVKGYWQLKES